MTTVSELIRLEIVNPVLYHIKNLVYDPCDLILTQLNIAAESQEYGACSYHLDGKSIQFRIAKITPTKTGQFVTIWRRNEAGITQPFDFTDDIDFMMIAARNEGNFGLFIFPKSILANKGMITVNGKEGKRGVRVYPPWDMATNKQAAKTQDWQLKYFLTIKNDSTTDLSLIKRLFSS